MATKSQEMTTRTRSSQTTDTRVGHGCYPTETKDSKETTSCRRFLPPFQKPGGIFTNNSMVGSSQTTQWSSSKRVRTCNGSGHECTSSFRNQRDREKNCSTSIRKISDNDGSKWGLCDGLSTCATNQSQFHAHLFGRRDKAASIWQTEGSWNLLSSDLIVTAKTSRTCQPPMFTSNDSSTRKSHKGTLSQTDSSFSLAAKCSPGDLGK